MDKERAQRGESREGRESEGPINTSLDQPLLLSMRSLSHNMDMSAASTSNHHQGYRNESREASQSQTAHIDCGTSKYENLRSSQSWGV